MRPRFSQVIVVMALTASMGHAQRAANTPNEYDMYCSGVVTTEKVPTNTYVISGQESDQHIIYHKGQFVFINKGAKQGVKVGDQFLVSRPESDPQIATQWIEAQATITKAMGTMYADLGRLKVSSVQEDTSVAEIVQSCDYIERDDIVLPFTPRPAPPYKAQTNFDQFAPPSAKPSAIIASTLDFGVSAGKGTIVYVNLSAKQGARVGDYVRIFRYQDNHHDEVYEIPKGDYQTFGFGSDPKAYNWKELPRDVLGEGIVLRVSPTSATVLITESLRDMYIGDHVEIE